MRRGRSKMLRDIEDEDDGVGVTKTNKRKNEKNNKKSEKAKDLKEEENKQELLDYIKEIEENLKEFKVKPKFMKKKKETKELKKIQNITDFYLISPIELYYKIKFDMFNKHSLDEEKCSICLDTFYDDLISKTFDEVKDLAESKNEEYNVVLFENCSDHFFHADCIINLIGDKDYIKCPNCNKIYGILTGDQPKGTMRAVLNKKMKCDGYEKHGTIVINYHFPNGKGYQGTSREAYLPNNDEGLEILGLFKAAFDRKLLFTIGTSVTTGRHNQTIWNGIHHKTNTDGGAQNFGYPDPTYFSRVKQELASKGVLEENLSQSAIKIGKSFLKS